MNPVLCTLHLLLVSFISFSAEQSQVTGSKDSTNTIFAIVKISNVPYISDT